jgi:hypothetical protein
MLDLCPSASTWLCSHLRGLSKSLSRKEATITFQCSFIPNVPHADKSQFPLTQLDQRFPIANPPGHVVDPFAKQIPNLTLHTHRGTNFFQAISVRTTTVEISLLLLSAFLHPLPCAHSLLSASSQGSGISDLVKCCEGHGGTLAPAFQ